MLCVSDRIPCLHLFDGAHRGHVVHLGAPLVVAVVLSSVRHVPQVLTAPEVLMLITDPPEEKSQSQRVNRVTESQSQRVTESQNQRVTESQSQNHRVKESQSQRVTESQNHRVKESQSHRITVKESQSQRVTESQSQRQRFIFLYFFL